MIQSELISRQQKYQKKGKKKFIYELYKQKYLILLALPAVVLIFVFHYIPMYGIIIAFKNYNAAKGITGSSWVGLKYFKLFFQNPYWIRLIKNTFLLGLYSLLWGFPAPIILALLLNEIRSSKFKKITQTITYFPHFLSVIILVGMLKDFAAMDGLFNRIRLCFNLQPVLFFSECKYFRTMYIGSGIWQGIGWGTIIYLASLTNVNLNLYEAAEIDGANRFKKCLHVTIPAILPTITILLILNMGSIINVGFEKVLLMYNQGIYEVADVISTYVYREGIEGARYSYTTAVGLMNSVISLIFVVSANYISRKISNTSLW